MCKYLYCDIKNGYKEIPLNLIISNTLNKENNIRNFCQMCYLESNNVTEKHIIYKYPEILIIVLKNNHNSKIKFDSKIKLNEYEYNIVSCITKLNNKNSYDMLFYDNLKWIIFKYNYQFIEEKKENILYPEVIFCIKNNKNKKYIHDNKNVIIDSSIKNDNHIIINNNINKCNNKSIYMNDDKITLEKNINEKNLTVNIMKDDINNIESIESINNKINNQLKIINNKINNISNNNNIINYNLINNTNMNNNNNKNINNQNLFNLLVNNNNLNNNINKNISNDNQITYTQKKNKELITLYFKFNIGKEIYIDVEESLLFSMVIEEL